MATRISAACCVSALAVALTLLCRGATVSAQEARSSAAAKELAEVLDRLKLDSIAAPDPSVPGTFVAALYFPGTQLLVVSAKYSVPTLLTDKLAKKDYRDVYIDLNAASVAGTKTFVIDQGADGLVAKPEESHGADTWEQGNKTTTFDGDWRSAKMSEQEYMKAFASADAEYTRLLKVLAEQAPKSGS